MPADRHARAPRAPRHYALVPAAGVGVRVGAPIPKQYLAIGQRTMLEWSVDALRAAAWIETVLVVVAPGDAQARERLADRDRVRLIDAGGATRRDTVLAGLRVLSRVAHADDWVLVHDAARPGLSLALLDRLREALVDSSTGGLLALPAADTIKRSDDAGAIAQTIDRNQLWLAQTPQMFRVGALLGALLACGDVTDEASAMERAGYAPRLVPGSRSNFKVTDAEDLEWMRMLLEARR